MLFLQKHQGGAGEGHGHQPQGDGVAGFGIVPGSGNSEGAFGISLGKVEGDFVLAGLQRLQIGIVQQDNGAGFCLKVGLVQLLAVNGNALEVSKGAVGGEGQGGTAALGPGRLVALGDFVDGLCRLAGLGGSRGLRLGGSRGLRLGGFGSLRLSRLRLGSFSDGEALADLSGVA